MPNIHLEFPERTVLLKTKSNFPYCLIWKGVIEIMSLPTGYGLTGPLRDTAGHDLNYLSLAGVALFSRWYSI